MILTLFEAERRFSLPCCISETMVTLLLEAVVRFSNDCCLRTKEQNIPHTFPILSSYLLSCTNTHINTVVILLIHKHTHMSDTKHETHT